MRIVKGVAVAFGLFVSIVAVSALAQAALLSIVILFDRGF